MRNFELNESTYSQFYYMLVDVEEQILNAMKGDGGFEETMMEKYGIDADDLSDLTNEVIDLFVSLEPYMNDEDIERVNKEW